jgi:hypothetical protein
MVRLKSTFLVLLGISLLSISNATATEISFGDSSVFWPGWNRGNSGYGYEDDKLDTIGDPNFVGGTVQVNQQGYLTSIVIQQNSQNDSSYNVLSPGDLFINSNYARNGDVWNYVIDLTSWSESRANNPDPGEGYYKIYSISAPYGDSSYNQGYILSGSDNTGGWSGYIIRDGHPVAWDWGGPEPETEMKAHFSGWHDKYNESWTFIFPNPDIQLGSLFTIGWQTNCANDVLFEKIANPNPVPEPATLLLVGSGLIGLTWFLRRSRRKRHAVIESMGERQGQIVAVPLTLQRG